MIGMEILVVSGSWLTALAAIITVIYDRRKNGRNQAATDATIAEKLNEVIKKLDDPDIGLLALSKRQASVDVRLSIAERDIDNIKETKSSR